MMLYPKCRDCGRSMLRTTLTRALLVLGNPPDELRSRARSTPTFWCPRCLVVAVER